MKQKNLDLVSDPDWEDLKQQCEQVGGVKELDLKGRALSYGVSPKDLRRIDKRRRKTLFKRRQPITIIV